MADRTVSIDVDELQFLHNAYSALELLVGEASGDMVIDISPVIRILNGKLNSILEAGNE